jgi:DNA polymerase I-like protein with 3'-5' exonuclease and polymerase domains
MRERPERLETDPDEFRSVLADSTIIVADFETSDVRPRVAAFAGLGVYFPESHRCFYLNIGHAIRDDRFPLVSEQQLAELLRSFLLNPTNVLVMHNASYDLRMMLKLELDIRCKVCCTLIQTHRIDENMRTFGAEPTSHTHLERVTYGLKELTVVFFKQRPPKLDSITGGKNTIFTPVEQVAKYCSLDVVNTFNLYDRAQLVFDCDPVLRKLIDEIDDPNNIVLAKMIWAGISIDVDEARRQRTAYESAIQACREEIWKLLDTQAALETPDEIVRLIRRLHLEKELEYDPYPVGDDEERASLTRDRLASLIRECSNERSRTVLALLISKMQMQQRIWSFLNPLPKHVRYSDHRLYANRFDSTLVTTRFSTSPNVQNLPKRADAISEDDEWLNLIPDDCKENQKTRNLFVAKPGYTLVSMDLSAAEPRYLAMLFQRGLEERDSWYWQRRKELDAERIDKYPELMSVMKETQNPLKDSVVPGILWPEYETDPLLEVFTTGVPFSDPYNALLAAMDKDRYEQEKVAGNDGEWLAENRWRGKRAFLALAYGSQAETLAPGLKWDVDRTKKAIANLESTYATLGPLRQLTALEVVHLGEVRSLWGRPRRLNGYYQLARPNPVTIQFYRLLDGQRRTYQARIIPLGSLLIGVQAFVEECWIVDEEYGRHEVVLAGNPDGTIKHRSRSDPFTNAEHFNNPPFRNINFNQLEWVRDDLDLLRTKPRLSRAERQAFNAMSQATGADHLRWLMNSLDREVCSLPEFSDCTLVLTVHDSLVYEVPEEKATRFAAAARPVMSRPPYWSRIEMKVDIEIGRRFGEQEKTS